MRHIERTKIIVHLLDLFPQDGSDPASNYRIIRRELEAFSPQLAEKKEIIAANKIDLATDDAALQKLQNELPGKEVHPISGASHQGVDKLLDHLWSILLELRAAEPVTAMPEVIDATGKEPESAAEPEDTPQAESDVIPEAE